MSWPIDIYSDLSEKITYNRANLPIYCLNYQSESISKCGTTRLSRQIRPK